MPLCPDSITQAQISNARNMVSGGRAPVYRNFSSIVNIILCNPENIALRVWIT
jgi:hypothetical protein